MIGASYTMTALKTQVRWWFSHFKYSVLLRYHLIGKAYSFLTATNFLTRIQQVKASASKSANKPAISKKRPLSLPGERPIPKKAKVKAKVPSTSSSDFLLPLNPLENIGIPLSSAVDTKPIESKDVLVNKSETKDVFEDFNFDDDVNASVDEFLFDTQSLKIDSALLPLNSMDKLTTERSEIVIDDMEWLEAQKEKKLTTQKKETKSFIINNETTSSIVDESQLSEEVGIW